MALEKGLDGLLEAQPHEVSYLKSHFTFIQPQLMEFVYLILFLPVKSVNLWAFKYLWKHSYFVFPHYPWTSASSPPCHLKASTESQVRFLTHPWIFLLSMELSSWGSFQFSQIYSLLINSETQSTGAFLFSYAGGNALVTIYPRKWTTLKKRG